MGKKRRAVAAPARAPRNDGPRRVAITAGLLFLAAALLRLAFLERGVDRKHPASIYLQGDATVYWDYAAALRRGEAYDAGLPFHPPLFAYALASLPAPSPVEGYGTPRRILAVAGAASVPLLYLLARVVAGPGAALAAAASTAASFPALVMGTTPCSELLYQPLLLASLLLCARAPARHPRSAALAGGVLTGLACLTRAEHLLLGPPLLAFLALRTGGGRRRVLELFLAGAAGAALVVTPWSLHASRSIAAFNAANSGRLPAPLPTRVLVTSYGPLNFALANHARASAGFSRALLPDGATGGAIDLSDPAHHAIYVGGYRTGLAYVKEHPRDWLALAGRKLALALQALHFGWGQGDAPGHGEGLRRPVDLAAPRHGGLGIVVALLAAAGAASLLADPARRGGGVLLLIVIAHRLATIVAFFGYVRAVALVLPLVHLLAAAGVARLAALLPAAAARRPLPGSATTAASRLPIVAALALAAAGAASFLLPVRYYGVVGSRDARGRIIDEEPVAIWRAEKGAEPDVPDWARTWSRAVATELREGAEGARAAP